MAQRKKRGAKSSKTRKLTDQEHYDKFFGENATCHHILGYRLSNEVTPKKANHRKGLNSCSLSHRANYNGFKALHV